VLLVYPADRGATSFTVVAVGVAPSAWENSVVDNVTAIFSATPVITRTATYVYACAEWIEDAFKGRELLHQIYSRLLNPTSICLANHIVHLEAGPLTIDPHDSTTLYAGFALSPYPDIWRRAEEGSNLLSQADPVSLAGGAASLMLLIIGGWFAAKKLSRLYHQDGASRL